MSLSFDETLEHASGESSDSDHAIESSTSLVKKSRNAWSDVRNTALVAFVKASPCPTPWRPRHGTNKEVWMDIALNIVARQDIFDVAVHWESAKEQLLKIVDKQRLRKTVGNFVPKNETELYIDEIIKHMVAEDLEKDEISRKKRERQERKIAKKNGVPIPQSDDWERKKQRLPLDNGEASATSAFPSSSSSSSSSNPSYTYFSGNAETDSFYLERERMRMDLELEKEKLRIEREKEKDEARNRRDESFMKLVQDQMIASQAMLQATQSMMLKIVTKLGGDDEFSQIE